MPLTRTGKVVDAIVEKVGNRKLVYETADFSESILARAINAKTPPGLAVISKLAKVCPTLAPDLLQAWIEDRAERDFARAQKAKVAASARAALKPLHASGTVVDWRSQLRASLANRPPDEVDTIVDLAAEMVDDPARPLHDALLAKVANIHRAKDLAAKRAEAKKRKADVEVS